MLSRGRTNRERCSACRLPRDRHVVLFTIQPKFEEESMRTQNAIKYSGLAGLFTIGIASGCGAVPDQSRDSREGAPKETPSDHESTLSSGLTSCPADFQNPSYVPKECSPWVDTGCTLCVGPSGECGDRDDPPADKFGTDMVQTRQCSEVRPWPSSCFEPGACPLPDEFRRVWRGCGC